MHYSAKYGHIEATKLLYQAAPLMALYGNPLPIDEAIGEGYIEVVKVCLEISVSCSIIESSFTMELFNHNLILGKQQS